MKKTLFIALLILLLFFAGCVSDEKNAQEARFFTDISTSLGAVGNGTGLQELHWRVNITNTADRTAEDVKAYVILHPDLISRMNGSYTGQVMLGDFRPGSSAGFNGSATFNATGLSKQDIAAWKPLFSIKITWLEDGNEKEQVTGIN